MGEAQEILAKFVVHRRQYKTQKSAFDEIIRTLEEGTVVFVCDFQERLQWGEQDEVQSQHWQKDSVTIFPCPIFFKVRGQVWCYSFQVLSDDMAQDNAWVQYVFSELLLKKEVPALLRDIGAAIMTLAIIVSDNCGMQFKCRTQFGWIADCGVKVVNEDGRTTDDDLAVEHHYFGSCHGKSCSDREGAVTKSTTKSKIVNMSWAPRDQRHLCALLGAELNFLLRPPTAEERATFERRKKNDRGQAQTLVTKVRIDVWKSSWYRPYTVDA